MKTLKSFLEVYRPKSPDEQKFVDKHVTIKHKDRNEVNGKANEDDVFNASNIKPVDRKANRQGYNVGEDEKVYEEVENVDEARVWPGDYNVTSEKSQFGGHRAKIVNKETGRTMYVSQHAYKKPTMAKKHGEAYLSAYSARGPKAADNATMEFVRTNKKHLHEEIDIESMNESELLDFALDLLEKTLTPAEMKKREEIAKAIERENPKMPMAQKMAIATAQAKKVAEEVEDLDESAKIAAHLIKRYGDNVRKSHVMSAAKDFGVDASKLAKAVRKKLGKTMLDEEQIDELSKETMQSYKDNAEWDKDYETGAVDPKARERRQKGIAMAAKKLTKEDVKLDEVLDTPERRQAYKDKAEKSFKNAMWKADDKSVRTVVKRLHGLSNPKIDQDQNVNKIIAGKKLTKEDIVNRAIEKYLPEEKKFLPLDRLLNRLDGLSETYVETLVSLFESLDEDNQLKMISAAETEEGIRGLLDFAISHRGE